MTRLSTTAMDGSTTTSPVGERPYDGTLNPDALNDLYAAVEAFIAYAASDSYDEACHALAEVKRLAVVAIIKARGEQS